MTNTHRIIQEVPGFYTVQSLGILRRTPGVSFDFVPMEHLRKLDAIDRVIHKQGATSPGPVGPVERPWYKHTHQVDNLIVLHGKRTVEVFHPDHGLHSFEVTVDTIHLDQTLLFNGPAMLTWQRNVFHRVKSDDIKGSASLNLATRDPEFNLDTNFSIYDLNLENGTHTVIREGHLDQPNQG